MRQKLGCMNNTIAMMAGIRFKLPGLGAGIVCVHGTDKMLAFTSDVTPRYVIANLFEGGKQAVAEAYRNLSAVGATPLATTDNLNFGNPEKPEIMGQFVQAIQGIGEAVHALNMPIVSGNVSLYNETDGQAILPTLTIGAVGLIASQDELIKFESRAKDMWRSCWAATARIWAALHFYKPCLIVMRGMLHSLISMKKTAMAALSARILLGSKPAPIYLMAVSPLAAFEMAHAGEIGVQLDRDDTAFLFGEDQGRYLIA